MSSSTSNRCDSSSESVHGSILRIKLINFLTYDSIEFRPGSKLNVIIGPNGSGKSTIVCAICLGLGGKTKIIGRAGNPSDYIKHGCSKATLEIELKNTSGRNFVIFREIKRDNTSIWKLNGDVTTLKTIEDLMTRLKIQIGNLCQFLPQDRVADFLKMSQQELLENTEKAVGDTEMYNRHKKLKELQGELKNINTTFESNKHRLENEIQINSRLEETVQNYKDRELFMNKIKILNKKKPWVEYENIRTLFNQMKAQKTELSKALQQMSNKAAPFQKRVDEAKLNVRNLEDKVYNLNRTIDQLTNKTRNTLNTIDQYKDETRDAEEDFKEKKVFETGRLDKLESLQKHLDSLKNELAAVPEEIDIQPRINDVMLKIKDCTHDMIKIDSEINAQQDEKLRNEQFVRGLEQELKQAQDVYRRRVETLRQRNEHAHKALVWLRDNKDQFKTNIYEPMMTLINVNDPAMAMYVESHISFDDMCAFVCEDRDDMNKFLKLLRDGQRLSVSAVLAPQERPQSFRPEQPVENFSAFGFRSYLRELFTAPDAVMSYLCRQYNVHAIPVGDHTTKNMVQEITRKTSFRNFYTATNRYFIKVSKYTGNMLTSNTELQQPYFLKTTFNTDRINHIKEKLQNIRDKCLQINAGCEKLTRKKNDVVAQIEELKQFKRELVGKRDSRQTLLAKIEQKKENVISCEARAINLEEEEEKMRTKIENVLNRKLETLQEFHEDQKRIVHLCIKRLKMSVQCAVAIDSKYKAEAEFRQLNSDLEEKEREVATFNDQLTKTKQNAKDLLNKARSDTGLRPNEELSNELKDSFSIYPNTIPEINALIYENQARADSLFQTDENVIREYMKRKKEIEQLKKCTENQHKNVESLKLEMDEIKTVWLSELESLIEKIDVNFGRFFQSLGCAGEVALKKGETNEEEFDKYAISLKVKYRDSEQLRELSGLEHSGGERSVGTILYMMALQELTRVPFRCVDEINQGMDATNERKVFELLVQISCRESTAQYFLLTPKLLPDLDLNANMTILTVFNGEQNLDHTKWNLNKFLNIRRELDRAD